MIGFWCLLIGVALGFVLGHGYANDVSTMRRQWRTRSQVHKRGAKLDLALKNQLVYGSLGNVRSGGAGGPGIVDANPPNLHERPIAGVPAPVPREHRQQLRIVRTTEHADTVEVPQTPEAS